MPYEWKTYGASVTVVPNLEKKEFGLVRRNGKLSFRNYRRPLKKGGLTLVDIMHALINEASRKMLNMLREV